MENAEHRDYDFVDAQQAAQILNHLVVKEFGAEAQIRDGVVLGSGLGSFPQRLSGSTVRISFNEMYDRMRLPRVQGEVEGHARELVIGQLPGMPENRLVLEQAGREHQYENVDPRRNTFWIRVMQALGVETVLISNAAGVVTPDTIKKVPALVLAHSDLLNDPRMNPLVGHVERLKGKGNEGTEWGTRFPHKGDVYDAANRERVKKIAGELGMRVCPSPYEEVDGDVLHEGTYVCNLGPDYESSEEVDDLYVRVNGIWQRGASRRGETRFNAKPVCVVGMSTVPEMRVVQDARQSRKYPAFNGARTVISAVTNYAAGQGPDGFVGEPNHDEVKANAKKVEDMFGRLAERIIVENAQRLSA